MDQNLFIIKADGTRERFDTAKLEASLLKAGATRATIDKVVEEVSNGLTDSATTHEIYRRAFNVLHKMERPVALKYSLKRAVMELGPSGFPFEKYVAEIFRAHGFGVLTDQTVRGFCVEHEVDVVAWNDKQLIMVEAKFHNDPMMRSDLKVILYVKARFDDLQKMTFTYGAESQPSRERKLTEAWLVTNTKFSTTAIEYGSCQGGVVMIGWDYPPVKSSHGWVGNLHDMLVDAKLHPVTCLTTLSGREKRAILSQGIVLAKDIPNNPGVLMIAGVTQANMPKILEEIRML